MKRTVRERKDELMAQIKAIAAQNHGTYGSSIKFVSLFQSRLCEEGIPVADAMKIASVVEADLLDINEEDDYIGDIALAYAEVCYGLYSSIKRLHDFKDVTPYLQLFRLLKLKLPTE